MREDEYPLFDMLAEAVAEGDDLETLTRPLLDLLVRITGLESAFLTRVDIERDVQTVLFARNSGALQIPEGLDMSWSDSLCKRALGEDRPLVSGIVERLAGPATIGGTSVATYLSMPVYAASGELFGTLCGASESNIELNGRPRHVLSPFAYMIARQVDRERLIARLQRENRDFASEALSDPLTGIPNRRALLRELPRMLRLAERFGKLVHVAMVDLDGFKQINDVHGHDIGDRFLIEVAGCLAKGIRESDYVARYGGDEFVVLGVATGDDSRESSAIFADRLCGLTSGQFAAIPGALDYEGASVGVVTVGISESSPQNILARADAAMYEVKRRRRQGCSGDGRASAGR